MNRSERLISMLNEGKFKPDDEVRCDYPITSKSYDKVAKVLDGLKISYEEREQSDEEDESFYTLQGRYEDMMKFGKKAGITDSDLTKV